MYSKLFEQICANNNSIVVTANQRLARHLYKQFAQYKISQQETVWPAPRILPINTWLQNCWQIASASTLTLLSEFQTLLLWQKIIKANSQFVNSLSSNQQDGKIWQFSNIQSLSQQIKNTWDTIVQWNLSLTDINPYNDDIAAFLQWAKLFEQELKKNNYITPVELPKNLATLINENQLSLDTTVHLLGFNQFSPAVNQLLQALKQTCTQLILHHPRDKKLANCHQVTCDNPEKEIEDMANWAKTCLQKIPKDNNCNMPIRIACVIPSPQKLLNTLHQTFTEVFDIKKMLPSIKSSTSAPLYNISMGKPLSEYPIIKNALDALSLLSHCHAVEKLSSCILSCYFHKNDADTCLAVAAELRLRQLKINEINRKNFLMALFIPRSTFLQSHLPNRWHQFFDIGIKRQQHYDIYTWIKLFSEQLVKLGWPGARTLSSEEYQTITRWQKLLIESENLKLVYDKLSLNQAINVITQFAEQTVFQPETNQDAPIQILGPLEAMGQEFDYMWIMQCDTLHWPTPTHLNPFLPKKLQYEHHLPHSNYQSHLDYTKNLQDYLIKQVTHQVIFSYTPSYENQLVLPSPLIADIAQYHIDDLFDSSPQTLLQQLTDTSVTLDTIVDEQGCTLLPQQYTQEGGSQLLQEQTNCPFRAYTRYRLNTYDIATPSIGLTPGERGGLAHEVFKVLWSQLRSQEALYNFSRNDITAILHKVLQVVVTNSIIQPSLFLQLEIEKLFDLAKQWLIIEKQREPFRVLAEEKTFQVSIDKLNLTVRVDRIDQLVHGHEVIIDYKTGANNPIQEWFTDPLGSIQMPLYATFVNPHAIGIAYAELHPKRLQFNGVLMGDIKFSFDQYVKPLNKVKQPFDDWSTLQDYWNNKITQLARDFINGQAAVKPRKATVCYHCQFQPFCRITAERSVS